MAATPPNSSASATKRPTEDLVEDKVRAPPRKLAKQSDKQPARTDSSAQYKMRLGSSVQATCKHEHGPGVICLEEKAVALLNHADETQYFSCVDLLKVYHSRKRVQVGVMYVPEHLEATARDLLEKGVYMGPTKNARLALIHVAFVALCWAKNSMDESSLGEINEFLILQWRDCIFHAAFADLKVDFLKERLKSITKAYLSYHSSIYKSS